MTNLAFRFSNSPVDKYLSSRNINPSMQLFRNSSAVTSELWIGTSVFVSSNPFNSMLIAASVKFFLDGSCSDSFSACAKDIRLTLTTRIDLGFARGFKPARSSYGSNVSLETLLRLRVTI